MARSMRALANMKTKPQIVPNVGTSENVLSCSQPPHLSHAGGKTQRMKKVPQTDKRQTEFNFDAVRLEPELQMRCATFTPRQRRDMAKVFMRYARQLFVSARVLEAQSIPWRRRSLPRLSVRMRALN